jgi:hypothetical protein
MHALGMYVDDAGLISVDDAVFDSSGAPVMRHGVRLQLRSGVSGWGVN